MASRKILASLNPPGVPLTSKGISLVTFFVPAKKVARRRRKPCTSNQAKSLDPRMTSEGQGHWIPAFAGMTSKSEARSVDPRLRGDDKQERSNVTGSPPTRGDAK